MKRLGGAEMKDGCKRIPAFFKVFIPQTSSQRLLIPLAFGKHMKGMLPKKAYVRDIKENIWPVEVVKSGDHKFYFQDGWAEFVEQNGVEEADFLVFQFDGNNIFDFKLMGKNTCEKRYREPNSKGKSSIKVNKKRRADKSAEMDYDSEFEIFKSGRIVPPSNPFFVNKTPIYGRNGMLIPKNVKKDYNIKLDEEIVLCGPNGMRSSASLSTWKDGRTWVRRRGWRKFCELTNLREEDKCIFEFVPSSGQTGTVLMVHVLHAGSW